MSIILKKYGITPAQLAKWFGYSNAHSFSSSSANKDMIKGIEALIKHIEATLLDTIRDHQRRL